MTTTQYLYRLMVKWPGREWEQCGTYRKGMDGWQKVSTARSVCTAKRNLVAPEGRDPGHSYREMITPEQVCGCDAGCGHVLRQARYSYRRYEFAAGTEFKLQRMPLTEWEDFE